MTGDYLTTGEAAAYLRLKTRKVYDLAAAGAIPCTKATGKWLFPRAALDRWVLAGLQTARSARRAEPMPIVGGSHDPLLEWALRESRCGLAILAEGSEAGLRRWRDGAILAAAIHLHASDAAVDANREAMRDSDGVQDAVMIAFARREQGLLCAPGNPLRLTDIARVAKRKARVAMRPAGAGAQLLLEALVARARLTPDRLRRAAGACPTGPDVAQAIRAGHADCGIATRAVARAAGLDFVPLAWECFDLVLRQRDYFRPPWQLLLGFARTPAFRAHAAELGGYDVDEAGAVRFAP